MGTIRQLLTLVVLLAVIAAGVWVYLTGVDPTDINSVKEEWAKTQGKIGDINRVVENPNAPDKSVTKVYKRKDAEGNWYFTNEPPKQGEESAAQEYRADTNVMPVPDELKKEGK